MILPLESQVVSLEIAKKLKSLNVKQDSLFYYSENPGNEGFHINLRPFIAKLNGCYSAYTASELGELTLSMCNSYKKFSRSWECIYEIGEIGFKDETEVNVRGKMLIHLIQSGLMEVPK